jgi:hypothetical protein
LVLVLVLLLERLGDAAPSRRSTSGSRGRFT